MIAPVVPALRRSPAHVWFENHLPELTSRCHASFSWMRPEACEEAIADVLASIFRNACRLADRGRLDKMTPFTAVRFFGRSYLAGRRFAGSSRTDVLADGTRKSGRVRVVSFSSLVEAPTDQGLALMPLSKLRPSNRHDDDPAENVRVNFDYPTILRLEHASDKARRVFGFVAGTLGSGSQTALARELGVSPARITQIKGELADGLARHDYQFVPRRSCRQARTRGRPRGRIIPMDPRTDTAAE